MSHLGGNSTKAILKACKNATEIGKAAVEAWDIPPNDWDLVAILYAGAWTQDPRILHNLGGFKLDTARAVHDEARRFGLWAIDRAPKVFRYCVGSNWHDEREGWHSLMLDYMVLVGTLVRTIKNGEVLYNLAERHAKTNSDR